MKPKINLSNLPHRVTLKIEGTHKREEKEYNHSLLDKIFDLQLSILDTCREGITISLHDPRKYQQE